MKHFFALLLSALMVLSLLTACGDKTTPSDGDDQTVTDENGSDTDNNTDDTTDPYDAVRSYWSEDQLTQAWGPDQVVEHLFFHPIIAYPQWAFHDCNASQDQRYGLDDWMVTVDEYNKILQSVYDKGYILVAMEDVWSEVTDESGTHMVRNTLMLPEGKKPLVIHAVKAYDDIIRIHKAERPKQPWIIHGFRGKPETAGQLIREGLYLSFGEYYNHESLKSVPLDRLFLETDEGNMPIDKLYRKAARIRNLSTHRLRKSIKENISRIFTFPQQSRQ